MNEIGKRMQKLRDGRGWYPEVLWTVMDGMRAFSSDGKCNVYFRFPTQDETILRCVEYCEWRNKQRSSNVRLDRQEEEMKKQKTIIRTYERTPKGDKMVARVTDKDGDEVFYGDPDEAQRIMARKRKPGEVLRCDTFFV